MIKEYNKLVRDRIPELIGEDDFICTISRLNDDKAYWDALDLKLQEEVDEYLNSHDPEELADILEVARTIAFKRHDCAVQDLEAIVNTKRRQRGGFGNRVYLISVEGVGK